MTGGHTVDPGKLGAAGTTYVQVSEELKKAGERLNTGVSEATVGKAWPHVADKYTDVIEKYRESVTTYGEKAGELGENFSKAAKAYEDGEAVSGQMISLKGGDS
ncbi:type VII secretion target [Saccharomonospora iraqiensis]|uniref:type VII secretion target n=1 Tax=Saccharomonospora iraqiensis TaxID=52698 RepID=UPI000A042C19|nr:type VII secretion target [Saccharomonospora iraqiensis]